MPKEYRCTNCHKLLFKGILLDSTVEIKCRGCSTLVTFKGEPSSDYLCLTQNCPHRVH